MVMFLKRANDYSRSEIGCYLRHGEREVDTCLCHWMFIRPNLGDDDLMSLSQVLATNGTSCETYAQDKGDYSHSTYS